MFENIQIKKDILADEKYKYLFSVEEVNKLVLQGVPFRDAYKQVAVAIESNQFQPTTNISHTHEGSIGNLQNEAIANRMKELIDGFNFDKVDAALKALIQ